MIYTVTVNPSLDYLVSVEEFRTGQINRADSERILPGGKGVNVSMVLRSLGIESTALGFAAGFTGKELGNRLRGLDVKTKFITLEEGFTRINLKLQSPKETQLNGQGPHIPTAKQQELTEQTDAFGAGDVLVLSGSVPASVPNDFYQRMMGRLDGRGVLVCVDAAGELLKKTLLHRPFLVKPNHYELGELFQTQIHTRKEAVPYAEKLRSLGAQNVLVSLAGKGAVLVASDGRVYDAPAPKGKLVNAVGAGDSMMAGFLAGWLEKQDYGYAFSMGIAAGSATAFSDQLAERSQIERLYREMCGQDGHRNDEARARTLHDKIS